MSSITIASILVSLTAAFAYINYKVLKFPMAIGIMAVSLVFSLLLILISSFGIIDLKNTMQPLINQIDFSATLMNGMLSFLLFAGALHVNLQDLKGQRIIVSIMAIIGTISSTAVVGITCYYLFPIIGFNIPFIYCLLFGALISPTDPVAVMAILKKVGAPKSLETKVVGESLFNDGIAVVIFISLLGVASSGNFSASETSILFVKEAIGGVVLGALLGYIVNKMLGSIDNYTVEIMLTLALVMGGYEFAHYIHTSGPITMVIAGLIIGNHGRNFSMSEKTKEHLDVFWELVDEFLNAVLFMLIGIELLILPASSHSITAGIIMIPILLFIRYISVSIPLFLLRNKHKFSPMADKILTWGGLRGGISVALVLSLPSDTGEIRDNLLVVTYCIVVFSILVQGLTIGKLIKYSQTKE